MIVNSIKKIEFFRKYFHKKKYYCLDTEFDRKKTYYSKLSIITISDGLKFFIFDILNHPEYLSFLKKIFKDKNKLKIFHGSDQDLEIFLRYNFNIEPFFDTQLAAGFLGLDRNISYANTVKKYLKIKIDKSQQDKDWLKRPISKSQINYLKKDVLYLKKIYLKQIKLLKKSKKLIFFNEETKLLIKKIKQNDGINAKFKKKLHFKIYTSKDFLKIIKLRELTSKNNNLPKNWVIKDEEIISMIKNKKFNILKNNKFFSKYEKILLINLIKKISKKKIYKINDDTLIKALEFFRYLVSKKYSIDANLIASKYDFYNYDNIKKNSKWRYKIFYKLFENICKGKKKFLLKNFS